MDSDVAEAELSYYSDVGDERSGHCRETRAYLCVLFSPNGKLI